jgi:hypothetical protein
LKNVSSKESIMLHRLLAGVLLVCASSAGTAAVTLTFDDLPSPPATDTSTGIQFANGGSTLYQGVVWDSRLTVVGDEYRVQTAPPGPLFGIPHSGHYFVTNDNGIVDGEFTNDGIVLGTSLRLLGAWFGRNEYYGFGAGADQVTIHALGPAGILASLSFDLPSTNPGSPEPLSFFDTSAFASLTGITGYRIDRRELGSQAGNWVADDFVFAPVPEPEQYLLLALGAPVVVSLARYRRGRRGNSAARRASTP